MDGRALSTAVVKLGILEFTCWILGYVATQVELARGALGASRTRSRSVVVCRVYGCARNMARERLCAMIRLQPFQTLGKSTKAMLPRKSMDEQV